MHHIDRGTPWDEIWGAMELLHDQGKILYVGSSNFAGWHLAQAQEAADKRNFLGLVSEQSLYNLMTRDVERELLPSALAYGIGVLAWSPLNRGMLGGILAREREGSLPANFNGSSDSGPSRGNQALLDENRWRLERFEELASSLAATPAQLALAWLFSRPAVTSAIVGPTTIGQLDEAAHAVDLELSDDTLDELNVIFPGFRTAPEDYAW
jgi:aryl-alcohol dehydrogenase-like predicted oxidoreductase